MKTISILLGLLLLCFTSYAEIFVIIDSDTKEIYTASERNDTLLPEGKELIILPGNWNNYEFDEALTNYKYIDSSFVKNISKIDKNYQDKIKAEEEAIEEELIQKRIRKIAIDELEKEGKVFKYIKR